MNLNLSISDFKKQLNEKEHNQHEIKIENNLIRSENKFGENIGENKIVCSETKEDEIVEINSSIDDPEFINDNNQEGNYLIPKRKMTLYLESKCSDIADKSTIYEYYYEYLNKIYNALGITIIILSSIITILESTSLANFLYPEGTEDIIRIIVIAIGFLITLISSIIKFYKFKDKIESIGKYIDNLNVLLDDLNIFIKKINYNSVNDEDFYKELERISIIVTRTNSSIFNINSDTYYNYYKRLKKIKSKKWNIYHSIKIESDEKFNEYNKKKLELLKERFLVNSELKKIDDQVKKKKMENFYDSDVYTFSTNTNEE